MNPKSGELLAQLRASANPDNLEGMARYGMSVENRLGVSMPEISGIAKQIGRDHALALELWDSGIAEARILAALVGEPAKLTEAEMDAWVADFDSWDVCDQVCMKLFDRSPFARKKVFEWAERDEEFVRRAAFSLIASIAWHDKNASDDDLLAFLPLIRSAATDERNFVKKAVSWALRHIGKRNARLNAAALAEAREIAKLDSKAARWIARDAIRELESEKVQARLKPKGLPT